MIRWKPLRSRAGFTLLELAVAVTVAAIVASSSIALFMALWGLDRQGRRDLAVATARTRLSDQFRNDVATAIECRPIDEQNPGAGIILSRPDGQSVRYVPAEGQIERLASADKKTLGREVYRLGDETETRFQIGSASPVLVSARLSSIVGGPPPDQLLPPGAEVRRSLEIVAVLGREQQLIEDVKRAARPEAEPEKIEPNPNPSPETAKP